MRWLVFLLTLPLRLLWGACVFLWVVCLGSDGGEADAEWGREKWLGRHHPTAHLPRHMRGGDPAHTATPS